MRSLRNRIYIGSRLVPWRSNLGKLASCCHLTMYNASFQDLLNAHNGYTIYCLTLLMAASGHRPVTDPFYSIDAFDLKRGFALIEDKEVFPARGPRLVWLPRMAVAIVHNYLNHLDAVSRKMGWHDRQLAADIRLLRHTGIKQRMPLFFLLEKTGKQRLKWKSITPACLKQPAKDWAYPLNTSRHLLASMLREWNLPSYQVEAQLGHFEAGLDIFSIESTVDVCLIGESIKVALEEHLKQMGWQALNGLIPKKGMPLPKHPRARPENPPLFGPNIRKLARDTSWRSISMELDEIIASHFPLGIDKNISDEKIEHLREAIVTAMRAKGEGILIALSLLRRKLSQARRRGFKIKLPGRFVLEMTPRTPFEPNSLYLSSVVDTARNAFEKHLAKCESFKIETRFAEIILSAILWGSITDKNVLMALPSALTTGLRVTKDVFSIDIALSPGKKEAQRMRWLPDPISLALIVGLIKHHPVSDIRIDHKQIDLELLRLVQMLGLHRRDGRSKDRLTGTALREVLRAAQAHWRVCLPGVLRYYVEGECRPTPVAYSRWATILTGQQVLTDTPAQQMEFAINDSSRLGIESAARRPGSWTQGKQFWNGLTKALGEIQKKGGRSLNSKKALLESANAYFASHAANMSSTGYLLAAWVVYLCEHGTPTLAALRVNSVISYTRTIGPKLLENASHLNLLDLPDIGFEDLYFKIVDQSSRQDIAYLIGRLQEFHRFLVDSLGVPMIDWTEITDIELGPQVDAGVVTADEYYRALDLLVSDPSYDERGQFANAMTLLLAFHFGLRRGEIFRLRVSDFLNNDRHMIVLIRNSTFGETKTDNGVRQIPLIGTLSAAEQEVVTRWIAHAKIPADDRNALLLASPTNPRKSIDVVDTVSRCVEAIRVTTGNPNARLRHLRHSFASRLFLSMLPHSAGGLVEQLHAHLWGSYLPPEKVRETLLGRVELSPRALYGVATAMGHGDITTTLTHYIHFLDSALHDYHRKQGYELGDKALAYAFGVDYAYLRKLKSRKGKQLHNYMLSHLSKLLAARTVQPVATKSPAPKKLELPTRREAINFMRISDADRLINLLGIRINLDGLAERFFLTEEQVLLIRDIACRAQHETGFTAFCLPTPAIELWVTKPLRRDPLVDKEARRARQYLDKLELYESNRSAVVTLAGIWKHSYSPRSRALLLNGPQALEVFLNAAFVLDLAASDFSVTIPKPKTAKTKATFDELATKLRSQGLIVRHGQLALAASRIAPESRIGITLRSGRLESSYNKTFHRLFFVILVWLEFANANLGSK
jgi:integrase